MNTRQRTEGNSSDAGDEIGSGASSPANKIGKSPSPAVFARRGGGEEVANSGGQKAKRHRHSGAMSADAPRRKREGRKDGGNNVINAMKRIRNKKIN